jgi:hypothetical protein
MNPLVVLPLIPILLLVMCSYMFRLAGSEKP